MRLAPRYRFLPQARDTGGLLPWVIAVMMYLASLGLVGGLSLMLEARSWTSALDHQITVRINNAEEQARTTQTAAALAALNALSGIENAVALDDAATNALLEPWLGEGNISEDLPIPALIAVTLNDDAPASLQSISQALAPGAPDAVIDDHQRWIGGLNRLANVIITTVYFILLLLVLATIAIVVFGTRSRLAAYRAAIEIMHVIGAEDRIIAREFQHRFMLHGLRGGLIGAVAALLTLLLMMLLTRGLANGLLPQLTFSLYHVLAFLIVPPVSALITMMTARFTVASALKEML